MKIVSVRDLDVTQRAASVVAAGGVVVFPTDTAYGLGADATNDKVVEQLYKLKGRDADKPMHVVVSDIDMANRYAVVNKQARALAEVFLPGPLTLILKNRHRVSNRIVGEGNTLGIRIPDSEVACGIAHYAGVPITATSANKSGDSAPYSIKEIQESFGDDFEKIDLVIDAGELSQVVPSTLVEVTGDKPIILRDGPISRVEIFKVVG